MTHICKWKHLNKQKLQFTMWRDYVNWTWHTFFHYFRHSYKLIDFQSLSQFRGPWLHFGKHLNSIPFKNKWVLMNPMQSSQQCRNKIDFKLFHFYQELVVAESRLPAWFLHSTFLVQHGNAWLPLLFTHSCQGSVIWIFSRWWKPLGENVGSSIHKEDTCGLCLQCTANAVILSLIYD